jgi:hypothetical protein
MMRRGFWVTTVFALMAVLGGVFPLMASAQFPSQEGGTGTAPGGFPSQGGTGQGGFYQSPTYDFSLSWGPGWTNAGETADGGVETISLSNGTSAITVGGFPFDGTPQDAVVQAADFMGGGAWEFLEVIADEPDRAAAYFTAPDGSEIFIDARPIDPATVLMIIWQYPGIQYDTEFEEFLGVIETLQYFVSLPG